ncbi:hypothetical protein AgCh_024037 [Apium graveolens]
MGVPLHSASSLCLYLGIRFGDHILVLSECYYTSGRLTEKSDVFSFGVVLVEMITGQPAILRNEDRTRITDWVDSTIKNSDIKQVIDPRFKATAESMTHDVLHDLLGLKSDMTGYASLLDNQQVQNITEKAQLHDVGVQNMDVEVCNLKKQLTEFVVEIKG